MNENFTCDIFVFDGTAILAQNTHDMMCWFKIYVNNISYEQFNQICICSKRIKRVYQLNDLFYATL